MNKRKNGIETYSRILVMASELFAKSGFDGVSMQEIAEKAGIKESSIYNHFTNKAEILDSLFNRFVQEVPQSRPTQAELNENLKIMTPQELLMQILLSASPAIGGMFANTAMIIDLEKFKNPRAAKLYYQYIIEEPTAFYAQLFANMAQRGMIRECDFLLLAEQYNYTCIALIKEYYMAKNGFSNIQTVMAKISKSIRFYCTLMK